MRASTARVTQNGADHCADVSVHAKKNGLGPTEIRGLPCAKPTAHGNHGFPSFDTAKVAWRVQADISWCADTRRDSVFVRFRGRGKTEADAVHRAIQNSLDWIDRRLFCYR